MNWRKIVINGKTYHYSVGRQNVVITSKENGKRKKAVASFVSLTGKSSWDIEKEKHKRTFSITPVQIKNYIKYSGMMNNLRGVRLAAKPAVSKTVTEGSSPSRPAKKKGKELKMITVELISKKLADICHTPKTGVLDTNYLLQLFIESHVLPKGQESYTKDEIEVFIYSYLLRSDAGNNMIKAINENV